MATFDSDGPAWTATERTRRTVALNPPEALQDLLQLVASILSKILDNPSDPKYRSLKQSSRGLERSPQAVAPTGRTSRTRVPRWCLADVASLVATTRWTRVATRRWTVQHGRQQGATRR